jgi:hypothetical protein
MPVPKFFLYPIPVVIAGAFAWYSGIFPGSKPEWKLNWKRGLENQVRHAKAEQENT